MCITGFPREKMTQKLEKLGYRWSNKCKLLQILYFVEWLCHTGLSSSNQLTRTYESAEIYKFMQMKAGNDLFSKHIE